MRVALASVAVLGWDIPGAAVIPMEGSAANAKIDRLIAGFKNASADFRILSIHTQDSSGNGKPEGPAFHQLKKIAERFILEASGDVVFGQGPHTWGGVKVLNRPDGNRGVIFTSLGNFIHPGLRTDPDNYIARALWDRKTLRLKEIQVHPFKNQRTAIELYTDFAATHAPNANFEWRRLTSKPNGVSTVGFAAGFR